MSTYKKVSKCPKYIKELIEEIVKNHYSHIVNSKPYVYINYKNAIYYKKYGKIFDLNSFVDDNKIEYLNNTIYVIYNYDTKECWVNTKIKIRKFSKSINK